MIDKRNKKFYNEFKEFTEGNFQTLTHIIEYHNFTDNKGGRFSHELKIIVLDTFAAKNKVLHIERDTAIIKVIYKYFTFVEQPLDPLIKGNNKI